MAQIFYTNLARDDIDSVVASIADDRPEAAWRFFDAVHDTIAQLDRFPELGAFHVGLPTKTVRSLLVTGFHNHAVFYRFERDCVTILRVLHGARDLPAALDE